MVKPHSIRDVIAKSIAKDLRKLFPGFRIEGHPARTLPDTIVFANMSPANLRRTVTPTLLVVAADDDSITFKFHAARDISAGTVNEDRLIVHSTVIKDCNHLSAARHTQIVELVHPDSIEKLEKWIIQIVKRYIKRASPD